MKHSSSTAGATQIAACENVARKQCPAKANEREKLIAEINSAFLCGMTGIEKNTLENSTAYIAGWLKQLKNDKRMVVIAAAQAQKPVDMISGESG